MPFPNKDTQFKPGESGNPSGKPKGAIHISTHIQRMLNEEQFSPDDVGEKVSNGTPLEAIIKTAIKRSEDGDNKWADWLAKYGYGQKFELEHTGEITTRSLSQEELDARIREYIERKTTT